MQSTTPPLPANATLFDGRTAAGQRTNAVFTESGVEIRNLGGDRLAFLPLAGLVRTDADAPARVASAASATFRARRGIERVEINDAALLARLQDAGIGRPAYSVWPARAWGGIVAGLVVAVAVAALLVDQAPSIAVHLVPRSFERGWSAAIEATLADGSQPCTAPAGRAALKTLIDRLSAAAGVSPAPRFTVLDTPLINALTLPDGRIIILRGLIAKAEDPDELSGVIAHELGHARQRDPTREIVRGMELNMLAHALGWGGDVAGQMTALSYGRRAEAAADASALQTLRRAHLRPDGLARFFTRLEQSDGGDALPAFLSDHPTTASRAATLQALPTGDVALDPAEWLAVKSMCQAHS
jgi:Zn-dependent protease with chaperone function